MFGVDPSKHIVAATGDGASVMVCFGDINDFEYVQCLNHGIHLSVIETLYKEKTKQKQLDVDIDQSIELDSSGSYS